ncbi:LuxR family transcriptional regulator [Arthrobacter sp. ISL-30]|uniref:helix-turn-helix transcriptional regulator n=1 Tax=Arthrobacter sp. ISL-30 TaxID=2819109 RepID=UPI001BE957D9|nr:LuxR family transcriptional regulator [Arthrobacter sp. ISL-30]MBT2514052.1 helix-turn-helix transcriptional regulator [Arthrobacter sp. ISL-30]
MSRKTQSWGHASVALEPAEYRGSRPPSHLKWSEVARSVELERIRTALTTPDCLGVVITGAHGVGKTSLGRLVVSSLGSEPFILQLRTLPGSASTPYSCFSFMLARLPQKYLGSPTGILQGITSMIQQDAGGRDVIIVVDNPVGIDDMSTGVLMNILVTGAARIIAIAPHASELPADFNWLLQDGRLTEVRLETLTRRQTGEVLTAMLGNRLTTALVSTLHAITGGNPMLLESLVTEQRMCGNLVLEGSVWTLLDEIVLQGGHGLEEIVRSRWAREEPETRDVIEMLACARRVPLQSLATVFSAKTLADMEDSGLLAVDDSERRWASLRLQYIADVVRGWLTVPRRRKLRSLLLGDSEPELWEMTAEDILAYAAWTHECQEVLGPAHARAAAAVGIQHFDPNFALRCVADVPRDSVQWVGAQQQKAEAYRLLAKYDQALAALDDVAPEQLEALSALELAGYFSARCEVLRWVPGRSEEIPQVLADARDRLEAMQESGGEQAAGLEDAMKQLELDEYIQLAHMGQYSEIVHSLEEAERENPWENSRHRLNCSILLIEAYAITGRELDALRLCEVTSHRIGSTPDVPGLWDHFRLRAFCAMLQAGQWRSCLRLLASGPVATPNKLQYRGAALDLARGMANLFSGCGPKALDSLLAAVAQLEHRPVMNLLPLAYAATAFAYSQMGDSSNSYKYLALGDKTGGPSSYIESWATGFCADMARRWLGEPEARERLIQSARDDIAHERYTTAGISLVGATVNGREEDFILMAEVAAHRQGPLARLSGLMAKGCRERNARTMMEAAELAASLELDAMEARCVAHALDFSRLTSEYTISRQAQARLEQLSLVVAELPLVPQGNAPLLTERERQIARLAGHGVSNRDIARDIGVSVRTVEGHLYQVFAKLSVSSRRDLLGLV